MNLGAAYREGVRHAWISEDARNPPDAPPPAWMVEVVREGCAQDMEKIPEAEFHADSYRDGKNDDTGAFRSAINALYLAIHRGHVVEPRPMPSDDDLLKAAREDAAQVNGDMYPDLARNMRAGSEDDGWEVRCALQARRNMLREVGAKDPDFREVGEPVKWGDAPASMSRYAVLRKAWEDSKGGAEKVRQAMDDNERIVRLRDQASPSVDLEAALKRAWVEGFNHRHENGGDLSIEEDEEAMKRDVAVTLSTLPAKE